MILPYTESAETARALTEQCAGILFTGGEDIDPSLYGEKPWHALGQLSPMRDAADIIYFKAVRDSGKPILGICRGLQSVNVLLGGSLYQDLDTQLPRAEALSHRQTAERSEKTHSVTAESESVVREAYGERFSVNSLHHQAVKRPAPGLRITARAEDGVVEALEGEGFTVLVQWHPEELWPTCESSRRLFGLFIEACRKRIT